MNKDNSKLVPISQDRENQPEEECLPIALDREEEDQAPEVKEEKKETPQEKFLNTGIYRHLKYFPHGTTYSKLFKQEEGPVFDDYESFFAENIDNVPFARSIASLYLMHREFELLEDRIDLNLSLLRELLLKGAFNESKVVVHILLNDMNFAGCIAALLHVIEKKEEIPVCERFEGIQRIRECNFKYSRMIMKLHITFNKCEFTKFMRTQRLSMFEKHERNVEELKSVTRKINEIVGEKDNIGEDLVNAKEACLESKEAVIKEIKTASNQIIWAAINRLSVRKHDIYDGIANLFECTEEA